MDRRRRHTADRILADLAEHGPAREIELARRLAMDPKNVRATCTQLHRLGQAVIERDGTVHLPERTDR